MLQYQHIFPIFKDSERKLSDGIQTKDLNLKSKLNQQLYEKHVKFCYTNMLCQKLL